MATIETRRRFSLQAAQQAQSLIDSAGAAGQHMSMAEALRRADGDHVSAEVVRREIEQARQ